MKFHGALIKEQSVIFAIIAVKPYVLNDATQSEKIRTLGISVFGMIPIVLMAQNSKGIPTYLGRKDIVNFLSKIHPSRIPWKEYTTN